MTTSLQLLPAIPAAECAPPESRVPAAPPRLVSLPRWTGWGLALSPGRASPTAPAERLPPRPAAKPPSPSPDSFRRKCLYCRSFFTDKPSFLYHPCRIKTFEMVVFWDFVLEGLPERRRKCSPFPRAHSRSFAKTVKRREEKRRALEAQGELPQTVPSPLRNPALPANRDECKDGPRPCPLVSCRAHMAFTVNEENGSVKENFPHLKIWRDPDGPGLHALEALHGSCGLDIADKVAADMGDDSEGVAGLLALYKTAISGKPIGQTEGMTLEEVAKKMGLSLERIRQIGAAALQEVRVALRRAEGARPGRAGR